MLLGVSVYPEQVSLEEIDAYLALASKYGFKKVFTSMFSVEGTKEEVFDYFKKFCDIAHQYGMVVDGDCNTMFLHKMGATEKNLAVFKEMGIDIIRMDMCYMDQRDVDLINNEYGIRIELSAAFVKAIDTALKNGANPNNFSACHNFYPERYTGADLASVMDVNEKLKALNIPVGIFISSNVENTHGPWPVHDGLPTLEDHRWIDVELQVRHLLSLGNVDEIMFGNAFASEEEFKAIDQVMKASHVHVPRNDAFKDFADFFPHGDLERVPFRIDLASDVTDLEKEILFDYPVHSAGEYTYYMLRSRFTRMIYKDKPIPPRAYDQPCFKRGDVVIVNDNLKHYAGEIQIVLRDDMKVDGQRNYLGSIPQKELFLLDQMKPGRTFTFMK